MNKLLLTLMLAIVSSNAMAEWVEFAKDADETFTIYVDPATIRKSGSKVKMWTLYDFSTVREIEGKKLMSSKTQYVSNCEEDEQRILYVVAYTESMGEGEVLESGNPGEWWIPIVPGSIDELLWKFACGK